MEHQPVGAAERPFSRDDGAAELDAAAYGTEHAVRALVEYQVEGLRFLAKRTHANLEFMRRLPHCRGWQDVTELQLAWVRDLLADCGEEVGRFAGTSLQLATSDVLPLQGLLYRRPRGGCNGRG